MFIVLHNYEQTVRILNHNITCEREVTDIFSVDSERPTVWKLGIEQHPCLPNVVFFITFNFQYRNFWFRPPFFRVLITQATICYRKGCKVESLVSTRELFALEVLHYISQFTGSGGKQRNVWLYVLTSIWSCRLDNMDHLGTHRNLKQNCRSLEHIIERLNHKFIIESENLNPSI